MKKLLVPLIILLLQGCGTIKTNIQDDEKISSTLTLRKTQCNRVPRIYSGIAYNWCVLNASPTSLAGWNPTLESTILDMAFCAIADTIIIPYTALLQINIGANELDKSK